MWRFGKSVDCKENNGVTVHHHSGVARTLLDNLFALLSKLPPQAGPVPSGTRADMFFGRYV